MKAYVINLDRRPDLWEFWKDAPVERWPAYDGSEKFVPEWFLVQSTSRRGAFGCFMSHFELWEHIAKNDCEALIFEDDCQLDPDFWERLAEFQPPRGWEMWYPGGNIRWQWWKNGKYRGDMGPKLVRPGILRPYCVDATHAYVITNVFARYLVRLAKQHLNLSARIHHVDWWLSQWAHGRGNTYAPARQMCGQRGHFSEVRMEWWAPGNRWQLEDWRFRPTLVTSRADAAQWLRDSYLCIEGPWDVEKAFEVRSTDLGVLGVITPDVRKAYEWFVNVEVLGDRWKDTVCQQVSRISELGRSALEKRPRTAEVVAPTT